MDATRGFGCGACDSVYARGLGSRPARQCACPSRCSTQVSKRSASTEQTAIPAPVWPAIPGQASGEPHAAEGARLSEFWSAGFQLPWVRPTWLHVSRRRTSGSPGRLAQSTPWSSGTGSGEAAAQRPQLQPASFRGPATAGAAAAFCESAAGGAATAPAGPWRGD